MGRRTILAPSGGEQLPDVIRYKLDDLGWYQFESLVQSLLKSAAGLAVESWGGSSDWGRDAYSEQEVRLSTTAVLPGPVVFQVKFIQAANAAGSRSSSALKKAVSGELHSLQDASTPPPNSYVLVTNAPLSASARHAVSQSIQATFPKASVLLLGSRDVCDMLDQQPELRRAFPELLSLRDLDTLISEAVNRDVLERSLAAVEETRDLVPLFVPTRAYALAWKVLEKHSFVVLDGAPEMGKTAIARTIGLTHLFSGWQVIDCHEPNEFFRLYSESAHQIFVADDAFGRTEYDPSLGRGWERSLPKVLHRLNSAHRLVLTTRKHVLQRALREMDLAGRAESFPDPAEVVVTATDLSVEERARMLYRHAKAAHLIATKRKIVQKHASVIVIDPDYTPERIRLMMQELSQDLSPATDASMRAKLLNAIRNPTERVKVTFQKLGSERQWVLIAFLECDRRGILDQLEERFRVLYPGELQSPFSEILDDLAGTFLRQVSSAVGDAHLSWIHPSYRDLVISELGRNEQQRWRFFSLMSDVGASMSLTADAGHDQPVLASTPTNLSRILRRCVAIVEEEASHAISILNALVSFVSDQQPGGDVVKTAREVALICVRSIGTSSWRPWPHELSQVAKALRSLGLSVLALDFSKVWSSTCDVIESSCHDRRLPEEEDLEQWLDWRRLLIEHYPETFARPGFGDAAKRIAALLVDLAKGEVNPPWTWLGDIDSEETAARLHALAQAIDTLDEEQRGLSNRLRVKADMHSPPSSYDAAPSASARPQTSGDKFDVERFFADL